MKIILLKERRNKMLKPCLTLLLLSLLTSCPKKPVVKPLEPLPPAVTEEEPEITGKEFVSVDELKNVYFEYDKYFLGSEAKEILAKNAEYLKANPTAEILVEGHCCECGTSEYNIALGQKRASAIKEYYISLGILASRIATISYGEEKPVIPNACPFGDTPQGALNRRGETKIRFP